MNFVKNNQIQNPFFDEKGDNMFIKRLKALIDETGLNNNKVLSDLGLNKNAINNWEKRQNIPDGKTLFEIAKYFNVSMEYLIGETEERTSNLSEDEKRLITAYRDQSEEGKKMVRKLLDLDEPTNRVIDDLKNGAGPDSPTGEVSEALLHKAFTHHGS